MSTPFRRILPKGIPESLISEYHKWVNDKEKYKKLYPVSAEILEQCVKNVEGLDNESKDTEDK